MALLFLVSMSAFAASCGGDDDSDGDSPFVTGDDDDSGDDDSGDDDSGDDDSGDDDSGDDDSGDDDSGDDDSGDDDSSGGNVDIEDIADGNLVGGSLHIEISGDEDDEFDLEDGVGFATGGFATLVFTDNDATSVNIVFGGTEDEPGGITIVSEKVVTGGVFGDSCEVTVDEDGGGLSGEFSCDDLDGYAPDDFEVFDDLSVKGEFSMARE